MLRPVVDVLVVLACPATPSALSTERVRLGPGVGRLLPQAHGDAHDLVALLEQEGGGHRRVDAARHGGQHPHERSGGEHARRRRSGLSVAEGDTSSGRRPMSSTGVETNEWANADHARAFLDRRAGLPRVEVAYAELLEILPDNPNRVLDLGCGDGKVMAMIGGSGVALDFSPLMLMSC